MRAYHKNILPFTLALALIAVVLSLPRSQQARAASWVTNSPLRTARSYHTATLLCNGKVLVAGGIDINGNATNTVELYDVSSGAWTASGSLNVKRSDHTATLLPNGKVLVAGGFVGNDATNST